MTQPAPGPAFAVARPGSPLPLLEDRNSAATAAFQSMLDQQIDPASAPIPRGPGKNDAQHRRDEDTRRRSPSLDPTAAAVAELASPGQVKPTTAWAQAIQMGQADVGPASTGASSAPAPTRPTPRPTGQPRPDTTTRPIAPRSEAKGAPQPVPVPPQPAAGAGETNGGSTRRMAKAESAERAKPSHTTSGPQNRPAAAHPRGPLPVALRAPRGPVASGGSSSTSARLAAQAHKTPDARSALKQDRPQVRFKLEPEDEKVAAQFGRGLAAALRQKGGLVTIRLQPEALGDLKIRMSLEPGKVGASFEVQTDQARQLLGKTMDTLKSALEARGLEVDRLDVQVADKAHLLPPESGQNLGGADADRGSGGSGSEHPEPRTARTARMPSDGDAAEPDIQTGPWMGLGAGGALRIRLDALA